MSVSSYLNSILNDEFDKNVLCLSPFTCEIVILRKSVPKLLIVFPDIIHIYSYNHDYCIFHNKSRPVTSRQKVQNYMVLSLQLDPRPFRGTAS